MLSSVAEQLENSCTIRTYAYLPPAGTYAAAREILDIYAPEVFDGVHPDPETWLAYFKRYLTCRQLSEENQLAFFPLFLKGSAIDWYDTQATQRTSMEELLKEFTQFFCPTDLDRVMDRETVFTRVQQRTVKVRDYFSAMQKLAKRIPGVDEDLLKGIIIRGLQPQIKAFVLQHQGTVKSIGDILDMAKIAETSIGTTATQGACLRSWTRSERAARKCVS